MQVTRRQLFAAIAAAVIGKPAVKGLPLAFVRPFDLPISRCQCMWCTTARQWVQGTLSLPSYEFYPVALTMKVGDTITVKKPPRALFNPES